MNKVISFRLNGNNPREAKALQVLKIKCAEGHGARSIIMDALLKLDEDTSESGNGAAHESLASIASQVIHLVEMMLTGNNIPIDMKNGVGTTTELTGNFLDSIKKAAKPGLKTEI